MPASSRSGKTEIAIDARSVLAERMLTVAIATFNRARSLERCLDALVRVEPPDGGWKLLVADDGSTDETASIVRRFADALPIACRSAGQRGRSAALNALIPELAGDLVVFCDDDILVGPDWLVGHRRLADRWPEDAVFGGRIVPEWETPPPAWILRSVSLGIVYGVTPEHYADGPCSPGMIWGGNMSVRRRAFQDGFRFDPRAGPNASVRDYRMGGDVQFVTRLVEAGYRCRFSRRPVVRHMIRAEQLERNWVLGRAFRHGREHAERHAHLPPVRKLVARVRRTARARVWHCVGCVGEVVSLDEAIRFRVDWHASHHRGFLHELAIAGVGGDALSITGPVAIGSTPDASRSTPSTAQPHFVGKRSRLATCGGVAWLDDSHVVTISLARSSADLYAFDGHAALRHVRRIGGLEELVCPENVALSPDGAWLAITSSVGGAVHLYAVDGDGPTIRPRRAAVVASAGDGNAHGVAFSACSRFLLYTTVDDPGFVRLCAIVRDARGGVEAVPLQQIRNTCAPYKPKGVAFSPDRNFVALAYGCNARRRKGRAGGFVSIHAFDPETGLDVRALDARGNGLRLRAPEDVNFLPDSSHVIVTDQGTDRILLIAFDKTTGSLDGRAVVLDGPAARLSFPHGNAVSRDGRYLAVANYGDDTVTVYAIGRADGGTVPFGARTVASSPGIDVR
jgi:glycosyltransferase involved in cell wall biosynthesis/DNA-binding beta-propeller fold protein YncE